MAKHFGIDPSAEVAPVSAPFDTEPEPSREETVLVGREAIAEAWSEARRRNQGRLTR